MIKPSDAISIIAKRLKTLIDTNQLDATYEESDSTLSVYIDDIKLGRIPLLTLRLSDHNVNMHYFYHNRPTNPSQTTNLSIEFYKPKHKDGKRVRNRVGRNVVVGNRSHAIPFDIEYYSYPSDKLDTPDIEPIYQQILNYVKGRGYKDPFIGTEKEAKTDIVSANFIIKDPRSDIPQNISGDRIAVPATSANYGSDYVSESKRIRLTESDLRVLIRECVNRVLSESKNSGYNLEKKGEWNVVEGSKMLGEYKGMEQFGWLVDRRLYDKNGEGIIVFSLGPGSITGGEGNKVVCARIITGQNHFPLRYKPLKKKDIPQEILRDIQRKRFSES